MTVIVALKSENKTYIASDGLETRDNTIISHNTKKFIKLHDGFYIGVSGLSSATKIIETCFGGTTSAWKQEIEENTYGYLLKEFIPQLKEIYNDYGFSWKKDNGVLECGCTHLIILNNKFFIINNELDLMEIENDYLAIGAGQDMANGYLARRNILDRNIDYIAHSVIESVSDAHCFCGGKVFIEEV